MAIVRFPLVVSVEGRSAGGTKDPLMVNAYKEADPDGEQRAVKRAGLVEMYAHSGTGQGVHQRTAFYRIVDHLLTTGAATTYALADNTDAYQFLDTPDAAGQKGFLVKSVNKLYYFEE